MSNMQDDMLPIINALQYAKNSTGYTKKGHFTVADLKRCEGKNCEESPGNLECSFFICLHLN